MTQVPLDSKFRCPFDQTVEQPQTIGYLVYIFCAQLNGSLTRVLKNKMIVNWSEASAMRQKYRNI